MAEDINFGTLTDRLNFHFGPDQVQKIDQGGTTVWVNNQVPVISITGPIVGTPGANNTNIQVTVSASQVIEFTYSDSDAADTVSTITVTDPSGGNVNVSGFSAGQNSGTCTFTIASSWFPTIGPVTSNNVFTITATDNRGGVATSTITVTAAAFNGPTISASNSSVTHPANASSTGTIPSPASGVFSKVSTTSTGLGFGNAPLTSNTLSAVWSNGTCGTSVSRTFYAASYDSNSGTWSGVSTKTVTLTVNGSGPYNATIPTYTAVWSYGGGSYWRWTQGCSSGITGFQAYARATPNSGYAWRSGTNFTSSTISRGGYTHTDSSISNPTSLTQYVTFQSPTTITNSSFISGVTSGNASSTSPSIGVSATNGSPGRVWQNGNTTFSGTAGVQFSWNIPYTSPGGFTLSTGPTYSSAASNGSASGGGTSASNYPSLGGNSLSSQNLTFPSAGTYIYTTSGSSFVNISGGGVSTGAILVPNSHVSTLTFNIAAPGPTNATTGSITTSFATPKVHTAHSGTFDVTANGVWNTVATGTGMTATNSGTTSTTGNSWSLSANTTGSTRTGTIKLYSGSTQSTLLDSVTWTQEAAPVSPPSVSQTALDYDRDGNYFTTDFFTVTSSVSFTVSDNQSWISTSTSGNTVTVYCTFNGTLQTRNGVVTVTNSGGSNTVNIRQFPYN